MDFFSKYGGGKTLETVRLTASGCELWKVGRPLAFALIFSYILYTFKYLMTQDATFKNEGNVRYVVREYEKVSEALSASCLPCVVHAISSPC